MWLNTFLELSLHINGFRHSENGFKFPNMYSSMECEQHECIIASMNHVAPPLTFISLLLNKAKQQHQEHWEILQIISESPYPSVLEFFFFKIIKVISNQRKIKSKKTLFLFLVWTLYFCLLQEKYMTFFYTLNGGTRKQKEKKVFFFEMYNKVKIVLTKKFGF